MVLQQALADLTMAYRNFFASIRGTRKGPKVERPRFRSRKDHRQAIRFTANFAVLSDGRKIRAPQCLRRAEKNLKRKARLYGREFHRIGRFTPTSQTRSLCEMKERPQAAARPRLAVPGVRGMAGPGHQRGGQRRQGRRAGGDSLQNAGKTGTRSGAAR
jgi:transposase